MTNLKDTQFNVGLVGEIPVLYTFSRLDRNLIDNALNVYDIQSYDDGMTPKFLAPQIMINHWGTLISKEPLLQIDEPYIDIEYIFVELNKRMQIEEYLNLETTNTQEMRL